MSANRGQLLKIAAQKLRPRLPDRSDEALLDGTPELFDEIVRALRQNAGLPDTSPLPGHSEVAARLGRNHQRSHDGIGMVALSIGAISDAVGDLGASTGRQFAAHEYHMFNKCLDTSTAAAIEEYAAGERAQQHHESSKRLGFLVHELRNALSSARMSFTALKGGTIGLNSRTGEVLERSLDRMQDLVDQGLVAVRLEAGIVPARTTLRVNELFRHLEAAAVSTRGVDLLVEVPEEMEVSADPRLLSSALENLLQNAFKFTRTGGTVVLRGRTEATNAILEVEDQCGGLPATDVEHLVTPFVQEAEDRSGLGLGLTIAREAVEAQGGTLSIQNKPGDGCVFRVTMPGI